MSQPYNIGMITYGKRRRPSKIRKISTIEHSYNRKLESRGRKSRGATVNWDGKRMTIVGGVATVLTTLMLIFTATQLNQQHTDLAPSIDDFGFDVDDEQSNLTIHANISDDHALKDLTISIINGTQEIVEKVSTFGKRFFQLDKVINIKGKASGEYKIKINASDGKKFTIAEKFFDITDNPPNIDNIEYIGMTHDLTLTSIDYRFNISDDRSLKKVYFRLLNDKDEVVKEEWWKDSADDTKRYDDKGLFTITRVPGKYKISITAIDSKGQSSTKTKDIEIPDMPPDIKDFNVVFWDKYRREVDVSAIVFDDTGFSDLEIAVGNASSKIAIKDKIQTINQKFNLSGEKPGQYQVKIKAIDKGGNVVEKTMGFEILPSVNDTNWFIAVPSWGGALKEAIEHKAMNFMPSSVEWYVDDNGCLTQSYINWEGKSVNGDVDESGIGKPYTSLVQNVRQGAWNTDLVQKLMEKDNASLASELAKVNKEGFTIDFEGLTLEQKQDYHSFLKRVNDVYDGKLWVALPSKVKIGGDWNELSKGLDYQKIAENVDGIVYMTMDENPSNKDIPVASPEFVSNALNNIIAEGVPAEKIVMVIPSYLKFTTSDMNGNPIYNTPTDVAWNERISWFEDTLKITKINSTTGQFEGTFKYWEDSQQKDGLVKGWFPSKGYVQNLVSIGKQNGVQKFYTWDGEMPHETYDALEEVLG